MCISYHIFVLAVNIMIGFWSKQSDINIYIYKEECLSVCLFFMHLVPV